MAQKSLGLIETIGLTAAIEAADAAMKSANVQLVGYELSRGGGMTTVKVEGDVGAVNAAISAARIAAAKVGTVVSTKVIARPASGIEGLVRNTETVGYEKPAPPPLEPEPEPEPEEESEPQKPEGKQNPSHKGGKGAKSRTEGSKRNSRTDATKPEESNAAPSKPLEPAKWPERELVSAETPLEREDKVETPEPQATPERESETMPKPGTNEPASESIEPTGQKAEESPENEA